MVLTESVGEPPGVRRVNSVPQILIDDKHIGGYDELMSMLGMTLLRET